MRAQAFFFFFNLVITHLLMTLPLMVETVCSAWEILTAGGSSKARCTHVSDEMPLVKNLVVSVAETLS